MRGRLIYIAGSLELEGERSHPLEPCTITFQQCHFVMRKFRSMTGSSPHWQNVLFEPYRAENIAEFTSKFNPLIYAQRVGVLEV